MSYFPVPPCIHCKTGRSFDTGSSIRMTSHPSTRVLMRRSSGVSLRRVANTSESRASSPLYTLKAVDPDIRMTCTIFRESQNTTPQFKNSVPFHPRTRDHRDGREGRFHPLIRKVSFCIPTCGASGWGTCLQVQPKGSSLIYSKCRTWRLTMQTRRIGYDAGASIRVRAVRR